MTLRALANCASSFVVASLVAVTSSNAQDSARVSAAAPQARETAAPATVRDSGVVAGKWRLSDNVDDMTNRADQRITLTADDSSFDPQGGKVLAQLIISCGNTFTRDSARSMLFDAGVPMVSDPGELMLRTDTDKDPEKKSVRILDRAHTIAFIGGFGNPRYSSGFVQKLLRSKTLRVRYTPAESNDPETVSFTLDGLPAALAHLAQCTWP